MKRLLILLVILLIVVAYLVGYWPQHLRLVALESQVGALRTQLDDAQARVRLGGLLGALLALDDAVSERNFGHAQVLSSRFFDQVRSEAPLVSDPQLRSLLESVLDKRDVVTVGLTRSDPATLEQLKALQVELRRGLGYPSPPTSLPGVAPGASPAPLASPAGEPAPTPSAEASLPERQAPAAPPPQPAPS